MKMLVERMDSLEATMKEMKESNDSVLKKLAQQEAQTQELKNHVTSLQEALCQKDAEIDNLRLRLRDQEQYSRNKNIEISGVKETPGENLEEILDNLARFMNVQDYSPQDVDIMHRVPSRKKNEAYPKIIVQFKNRTRRNAWLKNKRHGVTSGNLIGGQDSTKVYVNEHLTMEFKELLYKAKQAGKPHGYNIVWFNSGKVLAKKEYTDTKLIRIHSEEDFYKFSQEAKNVTSQ